MRIRRHFHVDALVITCEHGGNRIPAKYRKLFDGAEGTLDSHRGHDPGALEMAHELASAFDAPLVATTVSRLLVENNRSPHHRTTFSEYTRDVSRSEKERILERYYTPYRTKVESAVRALARGGRVLHVSSHSFTPVLGDKVRNADVGLLYDPHRAGELELCALWQKRLRAMAPELRVRRNYPYVGWSDGLTTYLRTRLPPDRYVGVELEMSQRFVHGRNDRWNAVRQAVIASLADTLGRDRTG